MLHPVHAGHHEIAFGEIAMLVEIIDLLVDAERERQRNVELAAPYRFGAVGYPCPVALLALA